MKTIAFYLPQYHEIPENNKMWGKGFTEWTNVKKAKPLFKDHYQPVEPLDDNYYDLTDPSVMDWQIKLARQYGIYGFCFYHYWYNGRIIMRTPIENYLTDKRLDFPFCICWANHDWSMAWVSKEDDVLYRQDYNDRSDWRIHFDFLLPYLKDERYIRVEDKPLLIIYEASRIQLLPEMMTQWNMWALEAGLPGLKFAYESVHADVTPGFDDSAFDYDIEYQPQYARVMSYQIKQTKVINLLKYVNDHLLHLNAAKIIKRFRKDRLTEFDYDDLWRRILSMGPISSKSIPGAFVNVDTTPRRQERGIVTKGMTPDKLEKYLMLQIERAREVYHSDMIFVYAWNEWAEGAYMEPDKRWGYGVLKAFQNALIKTNEFPTIPYAYSSRDKDDHII